MYFGQPGLATREEVRLWRIERGVRDDPDLCDETDAEWVAEAGEPVQQGLIYKEEK